MGGPLAAMFEQCYLIGVRADRCITYAKPIRSSYRNLDWEMLVSLDWSAELRIHKFGYWEGTMFGQVLTKQWKWSVEKETKKKVDIWRQAELWVHKVLEGDRQTEGYAWGYGDTAWVLVSPPFLGLALLWSPSGSYALGCCRILFLPYGKFLFFVTTVWEGFNYSQKISNLGNKTVVLNCGSVSECLLKRFFKSTNTLILPRGILTQQDWDSEPRQVKFLKTQPETYGSWNDNYGINAES